MSSVTHHRCAAPRCRWLGSVPIHRREDTYLRRLFPVASDTGTVDMLAISACSRTFTAPGDSRRE